MINVELLDRALEGVESESIRKWANSAHNRPLIQSPRVYVMDPANIWHPLLVRISVMRTSWEISSKIIFQVGFL